MKKQIKKIYTEQIAKLLDEHITAGDITNTETINIFDNELFGSFIKRTDITALEKANQINAEINYIISNCIRVDPALFQKFSELINKTILQHRNKHLSDSDFLNKSINILNELKKDIPSELGLSKTKLAFYRKLLNFLHDKTNQNQRENAIKIALDTYKIIKGKIIVHWQKNSEVLREMKNALDDYFYDVVGKKMDINFNTKNLSILTDSLIDLAIEHES